jgi:integrase
MSGPRNPSSLTRNLYSAMKRAKDPIPRSGEHLTPPTKAKRTFHSLRHTYGRIAMERGAELKWLQGQMGHATLAMTADRYGHFGEAARKRDAAKLEGAFTFAAMDERHSAEMAELHETFEEELRERGFSEREIQVALFQTIREATPSPREYDLTGLEEDD